MMNGKNKKMNLEKLRKQTKKNWKREVRSEYRRIMWKAKYTISYAVHNWCTVDIRPESYFAAWLVAKKLESKGFKCDLYKAIPFSNYRPYNELHIEWDK